MQKPIFTLYVSLLVLVSLLSCSEADTESYCPTWHGFTYKTGSYPNYVQHPSYIQGSPITLSLNDSVHVTARQDKHGQLINATDYLWTITYDTLDTRNQIVHVRKTIKYHTNYDGYVDGADDPTGHMFIPGNAVPTADKTKYDRKSDPDTITFVARYMYSGQGIIYETGNIVENTSYNGRIVPQSNSIDGGATGNVLFTISKN